MEKDKREKENENEETRRGEKGLGWTVWADRGKTTRPWQKKKIWEEKRNTGEKAMRDEARRERTGRDENAIAREWERARKEEIHATCYVMCLQHTHKIARNRGRARNYEYQSPLTRMVWSNERCTCPQKSFWRQVHLSINHIRIDWIPPMPLSTRCVDVVTKRKHGHNWRNLNAMDGGGSCPRAQRQRRERETQESRATHPIGTPMEKIRRSGNPSVRYIYIYMCLCSYVCVYIQICMCICTCIRIYWFHFPIPTEAHRGLDTSRLGRFEASPRSPMRKSKLFLNEVAYDTYEPQGVGKFTLFAAPPNPFIKFSWP